MMIAIRCGILIAMGLLLLGGGSDAAWAQGWSNPQPIVPPLAEPVVAPARPDGARCFSVRNTAPYTVMGSFRTNFYEAPDGTNVRAQTNFRLGSGAAEEFCSYGPFYDGGRLEITLRTIVPIFSCFTVANGEIVVQGKVGSDGRSKTWIECR